MFSHTPFRDIYLTGAYDLREMMRSRRALVIVVLYLTVAAFFSYNFVRILNLTQNFTKAPPRYQRDVPGPSPQTAARVNTEPTVQRAAPGLTQGAFFARNSPFREMLGSLVTEPATIDFLTAKPLISLYFMLVSLISVPFLIMITASEPIAQEQQTRGVRFVMLRTGRVEYVVGKALGQSLLIALVLILSAGVCMVTAAWKLVDFEFWPTLWAMAGFWPRVVAYCLPFVGLATMCSMLSSSTMSSRAFSLIGMFAMWVEHGLADYLSDTSLAGFLNAVDHLNPYFYQMRLWEPAYATVGPAMAILAGLGVLYVAAGLIFYVRRDL